MTAADLINQLKNKLLNRKKEVTKEIKDIENKDPFMQEYKEDGFRNLDDVAEEAADTYEHEVNAAVKADLVEEKKEIDKALENMKSGKYGICEVCGKKISDERLKIMPTATTCVDCEKKQHNNG